MLTEMNKIRYNRDVQGNRRTVGFEDFCQLEFNGKASLWRSPVTNLASGFPEQKLAKGVAGFFAFLGMDKQGTGNIYGTLKGERIFEIRIVSIMNLPKRKKISKRLRATIMERDGHQCVRCSSVKDLQIDHVIPVMCGGVNDESNLRVLCAKCNCSRNLGYAISGNYFFWRSRL